MPRDAAPLGGGKTAAGETLAARRARLLAASRAAAATTARGAARKSLPASPAGPLPSATQASSTRPLAAARLPHEAPELPHEALCLILASATSERALPTAAYFACVCTVRVRSRPLSAAASRSRKRRAENGAASEAREDRSSPRVIGRRRSSFWE